jgi:hypothetical protein
MLYAFLIGSALVIIGLTLFLFGVDQGLEPIGHSIGNAITHSNSYAVIITVSLILGFFISYAEPDLHILANQVDKVTSGQFENTLMVIVVSVGIGIMMTLGMLRILKNIRLKFVFTGAYALIFILSLFSSSDFLAIAWTAYRMASLHDSNSEAIFNSVIIVTDRRVLDAQLQATVSSLTIPSQCRHYR